MKEDLDQPKELWSWSKSLWITPADHVLLLIQSLRSHSLVLFWICFNDLKTSRSLLLSTNLFLSTISPNSITSHCDSNCANHCIRHPIWWAELHIDSHFDRRDLKGRFDKRGREEIWGRVSRLRGAFEFQEKVRLRFWWFEDIERFSYRIEYRRKGKWDRGGLSQGRDRERDLLAAMLALDLPSPPTTRWRPNFFWIGITWSSSLKDRRRKSLEKERRGGLNWNWTPESNRVSWEVIGNGWLRLRWMRLLLHIATFACKMNLPLWFRFER